MQTPRQAPSSALRLPSSAWASGPLMTACGRGSRSFWAVGGRRKADAGTCASALFELLGRQLMARQELVEIRPVSLGQPRRLTHVSGRDLQDLREITAR